MNIVSRGTAGIKEEAFEHSNVHNQLAHILFELLVEHSGTSNDGSGEPDTYLLPLETIENPASFGDFPTKRR